MACRYRPPQDRTLQAFKFTLEPSLEQWPVIRGQWGGRRYGVDVGVRVLATIATSKRVIARIPNSAPLAENLAEVRRVSWAISRCEPGSRQERERPYCSLGGNGEPE